MRRVWDLPFNTHNLLIPLISNILPLYDEIRKRMLTFIHNCLLSESDLVILSHGMQSGLAVCPLHLVRTLFHCCRQFDVHLDNLLDVTPNFVYNFFVILKLIMILFC